MKGTRAGLNPVQAEEYRENGVVRLPAMVPSADVEAMSAVLWRRLQVRCGAVRDRPETWTTPRPTGLTSKIDEFAAMGSPAVRALLDEQLGAGRWKEPTRWGLPLVTFPERGVEWELPHKQWHTDLPASPEGTPDVARIFLVLAPARAGGGSTGYVAGSHTVLNRLAAREGRVLRSTPARKLLIEREPWFAALLSHRRSEDRTARFMDEAGVADGVRVRACEMLGEPGDLLLMHPAMLHTLTPNVLYTPRLMLTEFVYGADFSFKAEA